jgi:hypothetical protein
VLWSIFCKIVKIRKNEPRRSEGHEGRREKRRRKKDEEV